MRDTFQHPKGSHGEPGRKDREKKEHVNENRGSWPRKHCRIYDMEQSIDGHGALGKMPGQIFSSGIDRSVFS